MTYSRYISSGMLAIVVTVALCSAGCLNPRKLPLVKKIGDDWRQQNVKYTEQALKESPVLQEIDSLSTKVIPLFEGFRLVHKSTTRSKNPYLSYGYHSEVDYKRVRTFYRDYFSRDGWGLKEESEGGFGPPWHAVFRKEDYKVAITHAPSGEDEVIYSFFCEKLLDASDEK